MKLPEDHDRHVIIWTFCAILFLVFGGAVADVLLGRLSITDIREMMGDDFRMILVGLVGIVGGRASTKKDDPPPPS